MAMSSSNRPSVSPSREFVSPTRNAGTRAAARRCGPRGSWALLVGLALATAACGDDEGAAGGGSEATTDGSGTGSGTTTGSGGTSTTAATDTTASTTAGSTTTTSGSTTASGTATDSDTGTDTDGDELEWPVVECDPLVPEVCLFPWPSNVYTVADPSLPTGRRLALSQAAMPTNNNGTRANPRPWNRLDGFASGLALMAYLPGASDTGFATPITIERSLEADSPTIVLDAETGERVAHWAELDRSHAQDDRRALMIRPVTRLKDGHRYIVALRGVVDGGGATLAAGAEFAALRDGNPSAEPSIEARRPLYADIFARLETAGVARSELQLAWDFSTQSLERNTADLLAMRDDALADVDGVTTHYEITRAENDWNTDNIAFRIFMNVQTPLYLTIDNVGGTLARDAEGRVVRNGSKNYEVELTIPNSALTTPAALLAYGHGLFGGKGELESGHLRSFGNEYGYALFGTDMIGMAGADSIPIGLMIANGDFERFESTVDRLQQGMLNALYAMRVMAQEVTQDPTYGQYLDADRRHYLGISQGGIFGGTYMALSTDVTRGCLGVPGQPYNLLLNRSVDFATFFTIINANYGDVMDRQILLALAQMLWERVSPQGWTHHITDNPLPGTPSHDVLIRAAVGDHQVTNFGAHIMARAVGAPLLDQGVRDVFGLTTVMGSNAGSTYVEYDFGLPPDPLANVPQEACDDPHGKLRQLPEARDQLDEFLRTGTVRNTCMNGVCSFPEQGGCP
jgi:hypothetical protein